MIRSLFILLLAIPLFALDSETAKKGGAARRLALRRKEVVEQIESMHAIRSSIDRTSNLRKKADAWLDLNQAADRLHELVGREKTLEPLFRRIASLGISVRYCEPDGMWFDGIEGYEKYLKLWPAGPRADEAWWHAHVVGQPCGADYEGPEDVPPELIEARELFMKKFPHSRHIPEARAQLDEFRKMLKK